MRLAALLLLSTVLVGCATAPERAGGGAPPSGGSARVGDAMSQPLTDFNLNRREIPAALQAAALNPYAPVDPPGCPRLLAELEGLDAALGPDIGPASDQPAQGARSQASDAAGDMAVEAVRDAASGWIPMRGVVRRMTGAEARARRLRHAILAGAVRRAYLKGLAGAMGCDYAAAKASAPPPR